jgi:hypothetical protein
VSFGEATVKAITRICRKRRETSHLPVRGFSPGVLLEHLTRRVDVGVVELCDEFGTALGQRFDPVELTLAGKLFLEPEKLVHQFFVRIEGSPPSMAMSANSISFMVRPFVLARALVEIRMGHVMFVGW